MPYLELGLQITESQARKQRQQGNQITLGSAEKDALKIDEWRSHDQVPDY